MKMSDFAQRVAPTTLAKGSLGAIIGQFKSVATKKINLYRAEKTLAPARVWQRNFHDRVLRDERELNAARRYAPENPLRWDKAETNR